MRRLEEQGLIREGAALLDREAAGYDMLCLISVRLERPQRCDIDRLRSAVLEMPEVLECHHVTGELNFLLKVVVRNRQEPERFVVDRLSSLAGIAHIRISLALSEIKATTALPLRRSVSSLSSSSLLRRSAIALRIALAVTMREFRQFLQLP